MKEFIPASNITRAKEQIDEKVVNDFIECFNRAISKGKLRHDDSIVLNNSLDNTPTPNDAELEEIRKRAQTGGWLLFVEDDNYNTKMYKLQKI